MTTPISSDMDTTPVLHFQKIKNDHEITYSFDRPTGEHIDFAFIPSENPRLEIATYKGDDEDSHLTLPLNHLRFIREMYNHPEEALLMQKLIQRPDIGKYLDAE